MKKLIRVELQDDCYMFVDPESIIYMIRVGELTGVRMGGIDSMVTAIETPEEIIRKTIRSIN